MGTSSVSGTAAMKCRNRPYMPTVVCFHPRDVAWACSSRMARSKRGSAAGMLPTTPASAFFSSLSPAALSLGAVASALASSTRLAAAGSEAASRVGHAKCTSSTPPSPLPSSEPKNACQAGQRQGEEGVWGATCKRCQQRPHSPSPSSGLTCCALAVG
jgi:hypothetical protein